MNFNLQKRKSLSFFILFFAVTFFFIGTIKSTFALGTDAVSYIRSYLWDGSGGLISIESITHDLSGNTYAAGYFSGTIDFDPTAGTDIHTSKGGLDICIIKMNSDGTYGWSKVIGGSGQDDPYHISLDQDGNIYVSGEFSTNADFDPGNGTTTKTSAGSIDAFLLKLNSLGDFQWVQAWGSTGADRATKHVISGNNIYVVSHFRLTVDFDPSAATTTKTSNGNYDTAVSKFLTDGSFVWVNTFGGTSYDHGEVVVVKSNNDILFGGHFENTPDFDSGAGTFYATSSGSYDMFIVDYDSSGNFQWVKTMGSTGADWVFDIAVDGSDNIYATGFFNGTVDFDPGTGTTTKTSNGGEEGYVLKLNSSGEFQWVQTFGSTNSDEITALALDNDNNVYVAGYVAGSLDFDTTHRVNNYSPQGSSDMTLSSFDTNGQYRWSIANGTSGAGMFRDVFIRNNTLIASGYTYNDLPNTSFDIDPGTGVDIKTFSTSSMFVNLFTLDQTPPAIVQQPTAVIQPSSATISWTTDENASTAFEWGPTNAYGNTISETDVYPRVTAHVVSLSDLVSCSTYFFRASSTDAALYAVSTTGSFTTQCPQPGGQRARETPIQGLSTELLVQKASSSPFLMKQKQPPFQINLKPGMVHEDVKRLQQYLNTHGFLVGVMGAGSSGNETTYFGARTKNALIKFQEKYKSSILTPYNLITGTGYFGSSTRAYINRQ